jgi:hypothetical protein
VAHPSDTLHLLERAGRQLERMPCRRTRALFETITTALLQGTDPREAVGVLGMDGRNARLARRNYYLLRALRLMRTDTLRARCRELANEIRRFETTLWPHVRDLHALPNDASELHTCLFHARRTGDLPTTANQLYNVATREIGPVVISREADVNES